MGENSAGAPAEDRDKIYRLIKRFVPEPVLKATAGILPRGLKSGVKTLINSRALGSVETLLRARQDAKLKAGRRNYSKAEIAEQLRAIPTPEGAIVFLHSGLSKLGYVEGGAETLADLLIALFVVERKGTLAMPAFSMTGTMYETLQDPTPFDQANTPSGVGKITDVFRRRAGVVRSLHPTHSVSALGPDAEWLTRDHHTDPRAFGPASPLGRVLARDGYILGLGTDLGPVTFYHVIEDLDPAFPLRVYTPDSPLTKTCRREDGTAVAVAVMAHDSAVSAVRIDKPSGMAVRRFLTEDLRARGVLRETPIGEGICWSIAAADLYRRLGEWMQSSITIYSTAQELEARQSPPTQVRP
jgi:aminoglycoside N3'-acetyltransferase